MTDHHHRGCLGLSVTFFLVITSSAFLLANCQASRDGTDNPREGQAPSTSSKDTPEAEKPNTEKNKNSESGGTTTTPTNAAEAMEAFFQKAEEVQNNAAAFRTENINKTVTWEGVVQSGSVIVKMFLIIPNSQVQKGWLDGSELKTDGPLKVALAKLNATSAADSSLASIRTGDRVRVEALVDEIMINEYGTQVKLTNAKVTKVP